MASQMALSASKGHPDGINFKAARHLREHPEFAWEQEVLRDLDSHPWTNFKIAK